MPSLERAPIGPRQAVIWHQRSTADRQDIQAFAMVAMAGAADGARRTDGGPASVDTDKGSYRVARVELQGGEGEREIWIKRKQWTGRRSDDRQEGG